MEFLRKLIVQTKAHLQGLTLSQRLAIGSCVALIAVALFLVARWASEPAMVSLLDQPLSAEEMARVQQHLDASGTTYTVVGDAIRVPVDKRARLLAQLGQQRLLPNDISITFNKIVGENSNPWLSPQEADRRWNLARANELSRVLREFDGIRDARVFIDNTARRVVGQPNVQPTASVFVKLADGEGLDKERVRAIASLVASAVSSLSVHNVNVVDATSGRSASVNRPEDASAFDDLEDRQKKEAYFADKVRTLLAYIPGLMVKVHADMDGESRQEVIKKYGKPAPSRESNDTTTMTRSSPADEPGLKPNATAAVSGGAPAENMETNHSEMEYKSEVDETVTRTESPRHAIKSLAASVNIPKSYLLSVFKPQKEPSEQELDTLSTELRDKIKRQVMNVLNVPTGAEDRVRVDWFPDVAAVAYTQTMDAASVGGVVNLVQNYWDKAGIGALAALGLLMMLMMVRKVGEGPVLPGEEPPMLKGASIPVAEVEEIAPVSEARESEALLVGKEVDEDTVRAQQVVQQVNELVKGDPISSAGILQRWIDEAKS
jgi:flagellar M-ring protein FliF